MTSWSMPPSTIITHLATLSSLLMYTLAQTLPFPDSDLTQVSQPSPIGLSTVPCPLSMVATHTLHQHVAVEITVTYHLPAIAIMVVMVTDRESSIVCLIL